MKNLETYPWDVADHLVTREDMAAYLEAALEEGDPTLVVAALKDIVRSQEISHITRETGLTSESLQQALSGDPGLTTVLNVIHSLGIRLRATITGT
jgi:probable addiction module antidote protein